MKKSKLTHIFLFILLISTAGFAKRNFNIIKQKEQYEKFSQTLGQKFQSLAFFRTPDTHAIMTLGKETGIKIYPELSRDKTKLVVRIVELVKNKPEHKKENKTKNSKNHSVKNEQKLKNKFDEKVLKKKLFKKTLGPRIGQISTYIYDISAGYIHILVSSNQKKLVYFKLAVAHARVISTWEADLNFFVKLKQNKNTTQTYDPLQEDEKEKFEIKNFSIRDKYMLVLTSDKLLYVLDFKTGKLLWLMDQTNPGCSLRVYENKFYYVHSMHLYCREIKTGAIIFKKKLKHVDKNVQPFVFGFIDKPQSVLIGISSKAGFSVYNSENGDFIYTAPFEYVAIQAESINKYNNPAGSAINYKYKRGVVYISWYDQWKPDISRAWLSAFNVKNAKILWNIPLRYNNGKTPLYAKTIDVTSDRIRLYGRTHVIVLEPGQPERPETQNSQNQTNTQSENTSVNNKAESANKKTGPRGINKKSIKNKGGN